MAKTPTVQKYRQNTVIKTAVQLNIFIQKVSVADPGCLSRIPDPDFYPSRIPDPGSKNSNKRER
jgi:hypothetical protein